MAKPRIALIGCGIWGKNHARVLSELGVLAVICDSRQESLSAISEKYPGIKCTTVLEDILGDEDISGVVVATPAVTHASVASRALKAGKDVLVEKPIATSLVDAKALVQLAREQGRVLAVGHILEYHPAILKMKSLIQSGELGKIYSIQSHRLNLGRIRTEENALWSFAPHDIAVILRLVSSRPNEVSCVGHAHLNDKVADTTITHMKFPSGISAHVFVSWLHPYKEQRLVVIGSKAMLVFDDLADWDRKLLKYPHSVEWKNGQVPVANKAESQAIPVSAKEPLTEEIKAFLESISSRENPITDGESGVAVLEILDQAQRSMGDTAESTGSESSDRVYVHPTATVDEGADIGAGTKVWHYSHIMPKSKIGKNCNIGQNVFIAANCEIGNGVKIQNNVSVYEGVYLADNVFCGPSVVFTNVSRPRSAVNRKDAYEATNVMNGATLGANSTIVCGTRIGVNAFVGAGAVVVKDVPDNAIVVGNPASIIGWACSCGERLSKQKNGVFKCKCGKSMKLNDNPTKKKAA